VNCQGYFQKKILKVKFYKSMLFQIEVYLVDNRIQHAKTSCLTFFVFLNIQIFLIKITSA